MGEWENGRVGEREKGRVGEWEKGRQKREWGENKKKPYQWYSLLFYADISYKLFTCFTSDDFRLEAFFL